MRIVFAARDGDRIAMEQLLACLRPGIQHSCRAQLQGNGRSVEDGEDLTQKVLLSIDRYLGRFAGTIEAQFRAWLASIVHNRVVDWLRRKDLGETSLHETTRGGGRPIDRLVDTGTSPTGRAQSAERAENVRRAMEKLSATDREVLTLRYFDDLPSSEIAALLCLSPNAVHQRIFRATKSIRSYLDGSS